MNKSLCCWLLVGLFVFHSNVHAIDQCSAISEEASKKATEISEKYTKRAEQKKLQYEAEAQKIENETPNPSEAEAIINFDIEVKMVTQELIMDLPEVTMKSQEASMDFPTTEMRLEKYSWDEPVTVMKSTCVRINPRVKCRGFGCTVEWDNVCTDTPHIEMRRKEASWDVPVVIMKTRKIVFDIPQVKMKQSKIKLDLPNITVKNVRAELKKAEESGNELSDRSAAEMGEISKAMKEDIATNAAKSLISVFDCNINSIREQEKRTISDLDIQIITLTTSKSEAIKNNAVLLAENFDKAINDLVVGREKAAVEFEKAIRELEKSRDSVLSNGLKS